VRLSGSLETSLSIIIVGGLLVSFSCSCGVASLGVLEDYVFTTPLSLFIRGLL